MKKLITNGLGSEAWAFIAFVVIMAILSLAIGFLVSSVVAWCLVLIFGWPYWPTFWLVYVGSILLSGILGSRA